MAEVLTAEGRVKVIGGETWSPLLSGGELSRAFGSTPSANALATASLLADQLGKMEHGILKMRGRPWSRSIAAILDYCNPTSADLQVVIRILAHHGYARAFFSLAIPANDDGLKRYLLDRGVDWGQILFYYEFSLWDPVRIAGGFLLGLGHSAASILEVAKELFDFGVDALKEPRQAAAKLRRFVDGVRQLSVESGVGLAKETLANWDAEFSQALLDLDFDKAGYMVGKLAGDLWQLFTGIRALAKLPGMSIRIARSFGALLAKGARYSQSALAMLVNLLRRLAGAIKEAVELGYGALTNFFENVPLLVRQLQDGALLIVDEFGRMLIGIPEGGLVLEGIGAIDEGFLLAQQTEGATTVFASVRVQFQKGLKYAQSLGAQTSKTIKKARISAEFAQTVKLVEKVAADFLKKWRDTLQEILTKAELPLNRRDFGTWVHAHLESAMADLQAAVGKAFEGIAEIQLRGLAQRLAGNAAELKLFLQRADTPLLTFAKARPNLFAALGVADEKELVRLLKAIGYENPGKTLIGDLISDGVLFNADAKKLVSVDWTSGLGRYRYANEFERIMKAGESLGKPEQLALAQKFLRHTLREHALREAILEFIFEGWETKVLEVMYEPVKLVK